MSGSNPPSTNGSPRLARRAILTATAALAAIAAPVGLVAATASGPASTSEAADAPTASFLTDDLQPVQAQAAARPLALLDTADEVRAAAEAAAFEQAVAYEEAMAFQRAVAYEEAAQQAAADEAARAAQASRAPAPAPAPASSTGGAANGDPDDPASWDRLAQCEAGGNWATNTGNGYYGGLQFSLSSWQAVGGTGYPHEHSRETQIEMGQRLYHSGGGWSHWPGCTRQFGWR